MNVNKSSFDSLFIIPDGELQVTRDNTLLLVVSGSITSEFENLSGEVLEDCSEMY